MSTTALVPQPSAAVTIRYSLRFNRWVRVNPTNVEEVLEHIATPYVLRDVNFDIHKVSSADKIGCGTKFENAGVATGTPIDPSTPLPQTAWENLGFDGSNFFCVKGNLSTIKFLRLNEDRHAVINLG